MAALSTSRKLFIEVVLTTSVLYGFSIHAEERAQPLPQRDSEIAKATPHEKKKSHKPHAQKRKKFVTAAKAEHISVSASHRSGGGGMMVVHHTGKTVSTITSRYIDQQSPMATVADLVSAMPGVVSASDGTGTTTFQNFNIRGMNSTEIGMIFEGMPASNAFTYSAYTPALIDSQNMGAISVTQGSVDVNAPVYNATGGQIAIALRKPSDRMQVKLQASGGSFNSHKEFARIDTGEIGHSGVRAFISASHQAADMWRGYGGMERYHVDTALTKQWSQRAETEVLFGWNQSDSVRMYYPSADQINAGAPISSYSTNNDPRSSQYANYSTKSTNSIYGTIKNHFDFGHGLALDAQGYSIMFSGPYGYGRSADLTKALYSGTQKFPANAFAGQAPNIVNGQAMTVASDQWSTQNSGLNLTGTWKYKFNTLKLGYWYSYAVADDQETYFPVTTSGRILPTALNYKGHVLQDSNNNTLQQLNQLSLDDRMGFFRNRLTIDGGIRMAMVNRQTSQNLPMSEIIPYRRKQINNVFVPAPQMLITYRFNDTHQVYVNATTGYHLPAGSGAQIPGFSYKSNAVNTTPINGFKPEYMINEEIGYRYNGPVMFNAAGFHYTVQNYQVSTSVQTAGCSAATASNCLASQLTNAGTLEAFGAQFELATRPWHHFSGYLTGSYLHTRMNNNIATKSTLGSRSIDDFLPTRGKQETSAPQFMGTLGLSYDDGTTFGRFNLHYIGRQYATLMNDASIPSYVTADLSLGRHLPKIWRIASMATINLTNMGGNHYLSYIYSNTNTYRNVTGTRGGLIKGSAPTYGIAQGLAVTAGLSGTFE